MIVQHIIVWILGVMSVVAECHGQSAPLGSRLAQETGVAYLGARAEAIERPVAEFEQLLATLRSADDHGEAGIVADAIALRKNRADVAAGFDAHIQQALANPTTARDGFLLFDVTVSQTDRTADPLWMEHMLKRSDLPPGLRWEAIGQFGGRTREIPGVVDPLVALLYAEPSRAVPLARVLSERAGENPDPKVPSAIAMAYKRLRAAEPDNASSALELNAQLRRFRTETARQAAADLVAFEQQVMSGQGAVPWDDAASIDLYAAARAEETQQLVRANMGQITVTAEERQTMRANIQSLEGRMKRRKIWRCVQGTVINIDENLARGEVQRRPVDWEPPAPPGP